MRPRLCGDRMYRQTRRIHSVRNCLQENRTVFARRLDNDLALSIKQFSLVIAVEVFVRLVAARIAVADADDLCVPLEFKLYKIVGSCGFASLAVERCKIDDANIFAVGVYRIAVGNELEFRRAVRRFDLRR